MGAIMAEQEHHVVISRKWGNPIINVFITDESISMTMTMDDFTRALAQELNRPPEYIASKVAGILDEMKQSSAKTR
jgi:hypothetical protein